jgi:alkylation response protein AidB-like acyl-CoA dehydrogenase
MNVALTEDEELLQQTARRVADLVGPAPTDPEDREDAKGWATLSQAGLLGLPRIEAGSPLGTGVASALVAEALAYQPCALPFVGSGVLAPALLVAAGADPSLLNSIESGELRVGIGLDADLRSPRTSGGAVVGGGGPHATMVISVADDDTLRVFEVPEAVQLSSVDLSRDTFELPHAAGSVLADYGGSIGEDAWARWTALALTTITADLCGIMRGALDLAVDYAKSRVQFGVPIGSFQAVKHLCADALVHVETSRSAMLYAAWSVDHAVPDEALHAARVAKSFSSEAAMAVTETCIQIHGGMGITWENEAHVFLRRALLDRQTLGDEAAQLSVLASSGAR